MEDQFKIEEEMPLHHYRTEIPNCILDAQLNASEFLVYCSIKRVAGDKGKCFMSHKNLAQHCNLSEKTLRTAIASLCEKNPILGVSLLKKNCRTKENGSKDTCIYTIIDLWPLNMKLFSQNNSGTVNFTEGVRQNLPEGTVKFTDKEEPINKNPLRRTTTIPPPNPELAKPRENAAAADKIFFYNSRGERDFAFKKDAFLFALNYPTEIVEESIRKIESEDCKISNFKKYLLAICDRLVSEKRKSLDKEFEEKKKKSERELEEEAREIKSKIQIEKFKAHRAAGLPHSGDFFKRCEEFDADPANKGKKYTDTEEYKQISEKKAKIDREIDEKYKNKNA